MQWDATENSGFTAGELWIGVNMDYRQINAAAAVADPRSVYHYYRALALLRRSEPTVAHRDFEMLLPEDERIYSFVCRLGESSCSYSPTSRGTSWGRTSPMAFRG